MFNIHSALEKVYALAEADKENKIDLIRDYDPSIPEINGDKNIEIRKHSEDVYNLMLKNQLDIIYDDRKVSLGNKFKDWELIGLNNIIIIGKNESINKTVTYKNRKNETKEEMSIENMVNVVRG